MTRAIVRAEPVILDATRRPSVGSEIKLQRQLNLSGRTRCQREAEAARRTIHIKLQGRWFGADRAKLSKQVIHMVEHVEEFRAEFEMFLLGNRKLFDQRGVPLGVSGAQDGVA